MRILAIGHVRGNVERLELDEGIADRVRSCDRIVSAPENTYPLDTGTALVIEVGHDWLIVEAFGGWVPSIGHVVRRASTCGCVCHRGTL